MCYFVLYMCYFLLDPCDLGTDDCQSPATCVKTGDLTYKCECGAGYTLTANQKGCLGNIFFPSFSYQNFFFLNSIYIHTIKPFFLIIIEWDVQLKLVVMYKIFKLSKIT